MTDRLDEQIRSTLGAMVAEAPEPLKFDRLAAPNAFASTSRRRWPPVAVMAAAVAAVLVVVGLTFVLGAPVDDERVPSLVPTATTPSAITSPSSLTWSRVPYDEAVFGGELEQYMLGVTVGGPGLVAVGGANLVAAVWTSPDGIAWSRVPNDEAVFGPDVAGSYVRQMRSVTAGGPGLVAVGEVEPDGAAVWTSVDGISWSRVPDDKAVFSAEEGLLYGGAQMNSVTVGGPGLVAVGSADMVAAVWTSVDGISWSRVPNDQEILGGEADGYYGQSMSSVTAGGPGLVAVGSDVGRAVVWTSVDGLNWSRIPHDEEVFGGAGMNSVTVGGPGLVAVGPDGERAAVWTSVDGFTWSRVPYDEAVFGEASDYFGDPGMTSVAASVGGLVAVGSDVGRVVVWTSVDGITWSRVPHDVAVFGATPDRPEIHMAGVIVGGPGIVAVGGQGVRPTSGPTDSDVAVWTATAQD